MHVVVSYDIVDDRTRNRVAKLLTRYGRRVQKSVFECRLDDRRFLKMRELVERELDKEEDGVRYYLLCERCKDRVEIVGVGAIVEDEEVIVV